jgi:hypothetical protein
VIYFTIIELLDAAPEDYEKLDGLMKVAGFTKTTQSRKGQPYKLPRGVYRSQCRHHMSEVLDIARSVAKSTGLANEIMAIQSEETRWFPNAIASNLAPAEEAVSE